MTHLVTGCDLIRGWLETPKDLSFPLILADYLEEQSDPRSELIRIPLTTLSIPWRVGVREDVPIEIPPGEECYEWKRLEERGWQRRVNNCTRFDCSRHTSPRYLWKPLPNPNYPSPRPYPYQHRIYTSCTGHKHFPRRRLGHLVGITLLLDAYKE